jgi:hypothetical protein
VPGDIAPREWGDGATDRRPHVIEDISYASNTIACRCGSYVRGSSPDVLADAWVAHAPKTGVLRLADSVERGQEPAPELAGRAEAAKAAVVMLGRRCTCIVGSDITTCPNYIPGDEEGDFSDDTDE